MQFNKKLNSVQFGSIKLYGTLLRYRYVDLIHVSSLVEGDAQACVECCHARASQLFSGFS